MELFPKEVCNAFTMLLKHACDLNLQIPVPEIVFIGPRGAGKSYLMEALLGRPFNGTVGPDGTRRPIMVSIVAGEKAKCSLKRDMFLKEYDRDVDLNFEDLTGEVSKRNEQYSAEPIVIQMESKELLAVTLIDTPGLIIDPNDPQSKLHEQLALRMICPSNRMIVVVRQASDAALPPSASDYVLDLVKQVDPEFTRTAIVFTRLHSQLQQFQGNKAVNKFLAGTLPDVRTFFATMPSVLLRERFNDPGALRQKILQASRRDLTLLEQLQYDKRFAGTIGIPSVVKYITSNIWRSYQESAPLILRVLRRRKLELVSAVDENTKQMAALTPSFFRVVASDYSMEFLRTLERLIRGTAEGNPAVNGQTLDQEKSQCGVDAQWVDARGIPIAINPDQSDIPHWSIKLYGASNSNDFLLSLRP
jgi:hypothetical protein